MIKSSWHATHEAKQARTSEPERLADSLARVSSVEVASYCGPNILLMNRALATPTWPWQKEVEHVTGFDK